MDTHNQEGPRPILPREAAHDPARPVWTVPAADPPLADLTPSEPPPSHVVLPDSERAARGLATWLGLLLVFGLGGLVLRMEELSAMVALSGLYVLAQAADVDPRWRYLHYSVTWIVPAGGVIAAVVIGYQIFVEAPLPPSVRMWAAPALLFAAVLCGASAARPVANFVAVLLFRVERPSHTLRLTARMAIAVLALAIPGWFALQTIFDELFDPSSTLIDKASLEAQLVGYILLAIASVGLLIRRDWKSTFDRLGIGPITASHLAIVALGVISLYGLNAGADWIQQTWFRDLWESDRQVNQTIAAGLGPVRIAMLGVSAGVGEEITLRGALQPKLGLLMTSLVFAALHLQYSWFGMAVIFVLSLMLGTIRIKTNTSVAMAVHGLYDIVALFSV
jgi:hypothetical protein